jgi:molecular chaperone GrpE
MQKKQNDKKVDEKAVALEKELEEYKTKYLRALADYQNFERRMQSDKQDASREILKRTVQMFLPLLDHMEAAEVFVKDQGLQMVKNQFLQTLQQLGVEELNLLGTEYDPAVAEVVDVVEGEKDNTVAGVLKKGFTLKGQLLRPAQVTVSKKKI